jgi:hypothetical protein
MPVTRPERGKARNASLTLILRGRCPGKAFGRWWVDPGSGWFFGRSGRLVDEALRVFAERGGKRGLARRMNGIGLAIIHLVRGHEADPGMVMVTVIPVEEGAAEAARILDASEASREARLVLEGLEMALGEWVVVGRVRPIVRAGDAEIGEQ